MKIIDEIKILNFDVSIILIYDDGKLRNHIINNNKVKGFVSKLGGLEKVNKKINEVIKKTNANDSELIKKKILNELLSLGYNIKYKGTKYLTEAIYLAYQKHINGEMTELKQYFYEKIAEKYSKNPENIKINIVNATASMYTACEREKLKKYFSFVYDYKPTPKIVIDTVLSKIV